MSEGSPGPGPRVRARGLPRIPERQRAHDEAEFASLRAELAEARRRLDETQQIAHVGSWEWDLGTDRIVWSDELYRMAGIDPGTVVPTYAGAVELIHPDDRNRVDRVMQDALHSGQPFEFEHRMVRRSGEQAHLLARGQFVVDTAGTPVRLFGTIQDVTDRVLAEEHARASEERLRRAMLTFTDLRDVQRLLHAIVETAAELLDAEYAAIGVVEPGGTTFERFIHAGMDEATVRRIGDLPSGRGVLGAVVATGASLRLEDLCSHPAAVGFPASHPPMTSFLGVPVVYRDLVLGHLYLTNKRTGPFDAEDEQLASALAGQAAVAIENARIIEREQEIGEKLRALNETRADFVATVSHELRTPVAVILGLSETLVRNRGKLSEDEAADALERIARQAARLSRLVADVLELSRLDTGRLEVRPAPTDVRQAVEEALAVSPPPDGRPVRIELRTGLVASADELRLEQVLVNLLTNAYRYGGPNVVIDGSEDGGEIVMRVRDDGQGVPAGLLPTLFERFNRGANVPPGGTGLGLAIAKGFVEAFGGSIRYVSGAGATFEIRLPKAKPQ